MRGRIWSSRLIQSTRGTWPDDGAPTDRKARWQRQVDGGHMSGERLDSRHRPTTVAEITHGLPSVLERLVADPGRWILIIEQGEDGRYVQFLALEGGTLVAEVSSNQFLSGDDEWTADDAARLVS